MHSGKNQALVHGSNEEPPPPAEMPESTQLTNGNAIVYPDNIVMHVSSSGPSEDFYSDEVRGWLGTIKLNRDTLNGKFHGVGLHLDRSSYPPTYTGEFKYDGIQTLEYIPCPK